MADLIDRQTIIETIHSAIYPYFCGAENGDAMSEDEKLVLSVNKTICTAIKALPTTDAVEVVRCKGCLYGYRYFDIQHGETDSWVECRNPEGLNRDTSEDSFCSYGERKDGFNR